MSYLKALKVYLLEKGDFWDEVTKGKQERERKVHHRTK